MEEILAKHPPCRSRILPYLDGKQLNTSPSQTARRHVIYLSDLGSEDELEAWPELEKIVRAKVKPARDVLGPNPNNKPLKRRWWAYQAHRPRFYDALKTKERFLVIARVSNTAAFAFVSSKQIINEKVVGFLFDQDAAFCVMQSRSHLLWTRFFSSSLKDDLQYTPSSCFQTFPFPKNWQTDIALETTGKAYYEFRAALMVQNNEGLTKTYNRFNDPDERAPDILQLRDLHAAMDRAVLDAYGWTDIPTDCEFLLDYEIDEEEWGTKKKPYRFRWPQEVHDEVLARLLDLNQKRAEEERLAGLTADSDARKKKGRKKSKSLSLFDDE